jgi:tRNA A-37 threonylcarbamoyl transferase component Bud32/tetratricopeptide (TPR) repeat protein
MKEHAIVCGPEQELGCAGRFRITPWSVVLLSAQIAAEGGLGMSTEPKRTCPSCGNELSGAMELCPVCMLRQGLAGGAESGESSASEDTVKPTTPEQAVHRFDHYELVRRADGTFDELGRGAMGVTYKAFDTVLRHPVALKVIDARIAARLDARERFLREARAAARLRHPNVASVFYYGTRKSDGQCFYAMELIEGETLEARLRRVGQLPPALALEVIAQVAKALVAAEAHGLVHRDLKPANLMLVEGPEFTVKVIDFGLAKAVAAGDADLTHGGFVGTPAFASPEQFAGTTVDVRADLYSLGITLWNMLTGRTPFQGTPGEVMYQHQHTPLPIDQLERIPQPVVVLLKVLLEKDPAQRFQTPAELLMAIPAITETIDTVRSITHQSFQKTQSADPLAVIRRRPARPGPTKISVARLPITGSDVFGREEDLAFLDEAWANQHINVVTIVAWAGVGKSTLVNHWLGRMAAEHYRSAEGVFGWSFYRQGASGGTSSADEFLDAALAWFGDSDPRIGTAWEKGERLAKLIAHRRTLLVLDGLEPLQNPPGPQEGRLRELSLQALLRDLAAFNTGLCVVTTRMPVADIADHERVSVLRRELEQLSSDAGAKLLRALGVKGHEAELHRASDEFRGHCLALTLLGSYLTDAYDGDIRSWKEVSERLVHDVRQGVHARRVMESYQTWFGEGPELSVLRMLGLFDRPADEKALAVLLKAPAIASLTESLIDLSPAEWRAMLGRLRRARLLAGQDPHNPGHLDTHPLVREYFGEQLQSQRTEAWKECNKRLYHYYRTLAPQLPGSLKEMEPLFLAVICACNAGLFREALHEVYIPRIQRGDAFFAVKALGARGALLSVLVYFFERGRWGSFAETGVEAQSLSAEDQLLVLMEAGQHLTATRGFAAREAQICYERVESLCDSLNRPLIPYPALLNQWRFSLVTEKLSETMRIAERIYSLAQKQNDSALMLGAYRALAGTRYFQGNFETARRYATRGIQIWRSGHVQCEVGEVTLNPVACLYYKALSEWHIGEVASQATMAEAISLARELNDMQALVLALYWAAFLAHCERNPAEVERCASKMIELSSRQNFTTWLPHADVLRGWARAASGDTVEGISWIEDGLKNTRATGVMLTVPFLLGLNAEALHLTYRTAEALEAIREAETLVERFENRYWSAELQRFRGVFLATTGADETEIEASFCEAIRIAKEQKSLSLEKRAEATYTEYRRQKASGSGGRGFRLPLC